MFFSCNYKKSSEIPPFKTYSENLVGILEYSNVYKNAHDSIEFWAKSNFPGYDENADGFYLDSIICFNRQKNKCVMALAQQDFTTVNSNSDYMQFFYGARIIDKWYFFKGPNIVLPREYYQKDTHTPLSFEKLHEIAMKEIFGGYLKKNELGEWEINERFFSSFTSNSWAQFEERKTVSYRFFSCENIDNEKDFWDCNYRKHAERNWVREKWFLVKDAPIYNSIDPLEVQWTLKKGTQVRVFEYVDGGVWCSMRAEGYMPNGLSDGKTRYVRRSDLTETDPHAPKVAKSSIKEAQRSP